MADPLPYASREIVVNPHPPLVPYLLLGIPFLLCSSVSCLVLGDYFLFAGYALSLAGEDTPGIPVIATAIGAGFLVVPYMMAVVITQLLSRRLITWHCFVVAVGVGALSGATLASSLCFLGVLGDGVASSALVIAVGGGCISVLPGRRSTATE